MLPEFSKILASHKPCRMCSKSLKKDAYTMISAFTQTEVTPVCRKCAIQEYYGKKLTINKRYIRDQVNNRILGIRDE